MVAPGVATCQVCFDETYAVITQICGASCSAVLCASCINAYVGFQAASALYGVVAQLKCPICLRPASLVRWREKLSKPNAHLQLLETKVHSACNVVCPSCHTNTSVLPEACDSVQPLSLPTHLAQQMPELRARCGQYCHHRLSADAVYNYVRATEAYYRSHLAAAARVALPDRLAPWLGGNGIHLGMSFDALAALKSDLWTPNMPITAVELPNYMARCVCCRLENVAELFPCLPPTATYDSASRISFVFDPTSQLRLVSLVLGVCYMPQWEPPTNAPLRTYFSTLLHGAATDQDAIVDHGHTVVSLETDDTLLVEFVDPRAPPEIDGRAFTLYFKRRREDIIRAMCQQRPVRQAMRAVQRHLRKLVWKRKWDIVLAAIQAMGEARR
ncbi:hypothetical protein SDRG_06085 [Saprolegnia diclina VS20]|uniref:RING-type domain-containing protein n=1 Tax=Saprolegnia diclina (strain VS20) TaxID=1156394 RepID=T0RVY3_SAPDV|nr:hypothetical protein SDRG_06085 [Saprolegnia diclina VS20]EQC36648.1 hypothetical protein SDRG_06085 [Saprolegnia diclina VS20]|eukprot:XP_008610069.1 hypothetical protein SDRG_06085 [Saprolegnia diclina VS20]